MARIQLITLISSIAFLLCVARLIVKGRLREEYAIIWTCCTALLVVFSIWRSGLEWLTKQFGIEVPTNLVFTVCIFGILVYLLHLSVVASKLRQQNKHLAQEMAMLKLEMEMLKNKSS